MRRVAESGERLVGGVYRLQRRIGAGAMGVVYAARHVVTEAEVALKLLHPHIADAGLNVARFEREVSVAARVGHPGIVKVFDAGLDPEDDSLFVAMELLQGSGLEGWLRRPGRTLAEAVHILRAVCAPLAAAHAHGIIHRDLKPDNVFVEERPEGPEVKLLDFGIARDLGQNSLTGTHAGLGTPHYMAPEQATDARRVTQSADVWSVGVMLYWYARGTLPFDGDGPFDTVLKAMTSGHASLRPEDAPPALIELVDRCLEKTPEGRPADGAALGAALDEVLKQGGLDRLLPPARFRSHETVPHPAENEGAIGDAAKALLARARAAARGEPTPPDVAESSGPKAPPPWPGSGDGQPSPVTLTDDLPPPVPSSVVLSGVATTDGPPPRPLETSPLEAPPERRWGLPLLSLLAAVSLGAAGLLFMSSREPIEATVSAPLPPAVSERGAPPILEPSAEAPSPADADEAVQEAPAIGAPVSEPPRAGPSARRLRPRTPLKRPPDSEAPKRTARGAQVAHPEPHPETPASLSAGAKTAAGPEIAEATDPAPATTPLEGSSPRSEGSGAAAETAPEPSDETTPIAETEEKTATVAAPDAEKPSAPRPRGKDAKAPPVKDEKAPEATDFVTF